MKVYVEAVLSIVYIMIGYCEKATNAHLLDFETNAGSSNFTRFAKELDDIGYWNTGNSKKNGHEWCAPFVNWVIWIASGRDVKKTKYVLCIPETEENLAAGCEFIRSYFKRAGRYDAKPKIGDLVIFTTTKGSVDADHVGFLTDISKDGLKIYTTEGNKDNKVTECVYPIDYWKILGFCHPRYDNDELKIKELEEDYAELLELKREQDDRLALLEERMAIIKKAVA